MEPSGYRLLHRALPANRIKKLKNRLVQSKQREQHAVLVVKDDLRICCYLFFIEGKNLSAVQRERDLKK